MARPEVTGRKMGQWRTVRAGHDPRSTTPTLTASRNFVAGTASAVQAFYKHPDLMPDSFYVATRRLISREAAARWRAEREAAAGTPQSPQHRAPIRAQRMKFGKGGGGREERSQLKRPAADFINPALAKQEVDQCSISPHHQQVSRPRWVELFNPSTKRNSPHRSGGHGAPTQRAAGPTGLPLAKRSVGRAEVMRDAHTNQPQAGDTKKRWRMARANGFEESTRAFAARLLECLHHRTEIEAMAFDRLTDSERFRFNHPNTVLSRWKGSTVVPDPNAAPKPSPLRADSRMSTFKLLEENHRLQRRKLKPLTATCGRRPTRLRILPT